MAQIAPLLVLFCAVLVIRSSLCSSRRSSLQNTSVGGVPGDQTPHGDEWSGECDLIDFSDGEVEAYERELGGAASGTSEETTVCTGYDTRQKRRRLANAPSAPPRLERDDDTQDPGEAKEDTFVALFRDFDSPTLGVVHEPAPVTEEYRGRVPVRMAPNGMHTVAYDGFQTRWVLAYDWRDANVARVLDGLPGIIPFVVRRESSEGVVHTHAGQNAAWSVPAGEWVSAVVRLCGSVHAAVGAISALVVAVDEMVRAMRNAGFGLDTSFGFARDVVVDALTGDIRFVRPQSVTMHTPQSLSSNDVFLQLAACAKDAGGSGPSVARAVLANQSGNAPESAKDPLGKKMLVADVRLATVLRTRIAHPAVEGCDAYAALLPDAASYASLGLDYGGALLVLEFTACDDDVRTTMKDRIRDALSSKEIAKAMRFVCAMAHPVDAQRFRVGLVFGIGKAYVPLSAVRDDMAARAHELVLGAAKSLSFMRASGACVHGYISPSTLVFPRDGPRQRLVSLPWAFNTVMADTVPPCDPTLPVALQTWMFPRLLNAHLQRPSIPSDLVALAAVYAFLRRLPLFVWSASDVNGAVLLRPRSFDPIGPSALAAAVLARHNGTALAIPQCPAFTPRDRAIIDALVSGKLASLVPLISMTQLPAECISTPLRLFSIGTMGVRIERVYDVDRSQSVSFRGAKAWRAVHRLTGERAIVVPIVDGDTSQVLSAMASTGEAKGKDALPKDALGVRAAVATRELYLKVGHHVPRLCVPRALFVLANDVAAIAWAVYDALPAVPVESVLPLSIPALERIALQLAETLSRLSSFSAHVTALPLDDILVLERDASLDAYLASFDRVVVVPKAPDTARALSASALDALLAALAERSGIVVGSELRDRLKAIVSSALGDIRAGDHRGP